MAEMMKPIGVSPISIKKITLWRREIDNQPGALADVLGPFAQAGADPQVIMRYRHPHKNNKAVVEVCSQSSEDDEKLRLIRRNVGLKASYVPALLIEGEQVPGLGYGVAKTIAELDIKIRFLVTQIVDDKYIATIGFENDADAEKAAVSLLLLKLSAPGQENALATGEPQ
jgi:hypothetical protein